MAEILHQSICVSSYCITYQGEGGSVLISYRGQAVGCRGPLGRFLGWGVAAAHHIPLL